MNIGPLRHRGRIEYKAVTPDPDYGTEIVTWTLLAVVWCGLQDELPSRSESIKQGLALSARRTRIRLRYRSDVDSSMRLVVNRPDPVIYQFIAGPAELGNRDGIELMGEVYSS